MCKGLSLKANNKNGIAICAPIAPYSKDRNINRELISKVGGYIEIFVNTPMEM